MKDFFICFEFIVKLISNFILELNYLLVSFDVTSLFPKVPEILYIVNTSIKWTHGKDTNTQ